MSEQRMTYRDGDGVRKTLIWDDQNPSQVTVHTEQDLEQIMAGIARDRELHRQGGDNKLAARLPVIVAEDLARRGILDDEPAFKAWLNSDEAAPWRVWKGRL